MFYYARYDVKFKFLLYDGFSGRNTAIRSIRN